MNFENFFVKFFFIIFLTFNIFFSKTNAAPVLKNLRLTDSIYGKENKKKFLYGEQIYILYTLTGLKENYYGNIWLDIDVSILDENTNIIHKNIFKDSIKKDNFTDNELKNHMLIKIPLSIINKDIILNMVFKDQYSHMQLSENISVHISPISLKKINYKVNGKKMNSEEKIISSSKNTQEINFNLFDTATFPQIYKKNVPEKENIQEVKTTHETPSKKIILKDVGEFPDARIKIFHEDRGLYSFKYPRDWIIKKSEDDKKVLFIDEPNNEAKIMFFITLINENTIDQLIIIGKQLVNQHFQGFLEIPESREKTTIAGKEVEKIKYKGYFSPRNPSLGEIVVILNNDENYAMILFLAAEKDKFDSYDNSYIFLINSFKITHSLETDQKAASDLIGTWEYSSSEENNIEKIITFSGNGRFNQNRADFSYDISRFGMDYDWDIFNPEKEKLEVNGKYKIIGDILYLFYDNGSYSEFALIVGDGTFIKLDQKFYKKKI